jgi:hypothetical protein
MERVFPFDGSTLLAGYLLVNGGVLVVLAIGYVLSGGDPRWQVPSASDSRRGAVRRADAPMPPGSAADGQGLCGGLPHSRSPRSRRNSGSSMGSKQTRSPTRSGK